MRACFAFWPLCTRLAFWALRAGIALRALRAGAALLALRPHDASNIDGAAVRQREDEPSPVRDLNRLHASGDQAANGHCDRIRNLIQCVTQGNLCCNLCDRVTCCLTCKCRGTAYTRVYLDYTVFKAVRFQSVLNVTSTCDSKFCDDVQG